MNYTSVLLANQHQVQLMYQRGSATPDTFPDFQQRSFFLRCDFQLNNSLNVPEQPPSGLEGYQCSLPVNCPTSATSSLT